MARSNSLRERSVVGRLHTSKSSCAAPTALLISTPLLPRAYAPGLSSFASSGGWGYLGEPKARNRVPL
jgi:hypothetical protein